MDGPAQERAGAGHHPGQETVAEASRAYDLSPSEVEGWVEDGLFQINGRAEERERNPQSLAKARLQAVVSILKMRHFNQVPMDEHYGIYRSGDVENGRKIEISVLPACPNPCCLN